MLVMMSKEEAVEVVHGLSLRIKALERNVNRARRARLDDRWVMGRRKFIARLTSLRDSVVLKVTDEEALEHHEAEGDDAQCPKV